MKLDFPRFLKQKDGIAAVEFALIAPMMILLVFGSFELVNLLQCNQRVENTAISLADVISRDTEVTDAEMEGLWPAVAHLMVPDNADGLSLRVTSISIDSDGDAEVVWSERCRIQESPGCGSSAFPELTDGAPVDPTDLPAENTPGSSLIRVEVMYEYRPLVSFFHVGDSDRNLSRTDGLDESSGDSVLLQHTSFRRSRLVDPIARTS